tara:strand:+ start:3281 stop:3475 length:195 start_codon:yes stop_codon:yes gene_type:complete
MRIQNMINMLGVIDDDSEVIQIAKGKYKFPYTFKEIYKVKKRELKYRKTKKDGKRKSRRIRNKE